MLIRTERPALPAFSPRPATLREPAEDPREDRLSTLESACLSAGYRAAQLGPVGCGLIGLTAGLMSEMIMPMGGLSTVLVTGTVGAWFGYDTRQAAHAFAQGPESKLWEKRAEGTWGLTPALQGGQIVGAGFSLAGGLAAGLLTGSVEGAMAGSILLFLLTHGKVEKAAKQAEQAMVRSYYPS